MSYRTRSNFRTNTDGKFTSGSDAWTGQEVEDSFDDLGDSVEWNDTPQTLTSSASITWSVATTREANLPLGHNAALSITGLPTDGRVIYGTCRVVNTGSFTMSMPAGAKVAGSVLSGSGSVSHIVFRYDGTNLDISITSFA